MKKYVIEGCSHEGIVDVGDDCCPHKVSGVVQILQTTAYSEGKPIAVDGVTVTVTGNPHTTTGTVIASNSKVKIKGKNTVMVGDTVDYNGCGIGKIVEGSKKVKQGG
jgi:hypothetical protein